MAAGFGFDSPRAGLTPEHQREMRPVFADPAPKEPPTDDQRMLTQHESDVVELKAEAKGLSGALSTLKAKLARHSIDLL